MIQSTNKYELQDILKKDAGFYYLIPKYQREYTWSYSHWNALFDDIFENENGYFIGSIICINSSGDSMTPVFELVDGQQRLTTMSLLMLAIYHEMDCRKNDMDMSVMIDFYTLKQQLANKQSPNGLILVPQVQNYNGDDFRSVMSEGGVLDTTIKAKRFAGLRKIYRCYNHFISRLGKEIEGLDNKKALNVLNDFLKKVNTSMLVKIEVSSHSDAFILFESLNNRGVPLTAIDLMKNLIMARAQKAGLTTDDCYDQWKDLLNYLSDDYKVQERFFRHFYNAFKIELNTPFITGDDKSKMPLGVIATRSNLLGIYEKLINRNLKDFLSEIITCGNIYSQICFPNREDCPKELKSGLVSLNRIQGTPSYQLLLYLIRKQDALNITNEQVNNIVKWLEVFFVRRNLTDLPSTRDLPRIFMKVTETLENDSVKGDDVLTLIFNVLSENIADDENFKKKLSGDIYKVNVDATRYILCDLAQASMGTETWTDLWARDDNAKYIWTIEHIFPEGDKIPKSWIDMIAGGDEKLAYEHKETYVHKIGNLTMTGYNSNLSNFDFIKKRDRVVKKDDKEVYVGYKNGLEINKEIAKKDSWTVKDIEDRTTELVTLCCERYKLIK